MRDRIEQLEALSCLRREGALDEHEFAAEKARLLHEGADAAAGAGSHPRPWLIACVVLLAAAVLGSAV